MKKKFLAIALAAAMALTVAPAMPANTTVAEAAETKVINIDKTIGNEDLTSGFWTAFSDLYKIEDGGSYTFNFDVYGGAEAWNNFFMAFTNENALNVLNETSANYKEFAVVRADSWGWGGGDNLALNGTPITYSNTLVDTTENWVSALIEIMKKATVSLNVTRTGDDIAIVADVKGKEDETKAFTYKANFTAGYEDGTSATDIYMAIGVDTSYIKPSVEETVTTSDISETVGAEDNSDDFWSAPNGRSKQYRIESDKTYTFEFENHGAGTDNWTNYVMVFTNEAAYNGFGQSENYCEYAVVRADSYGWSATGTNMSQNGKEIVYGGTINWDTFTETIKDSNVSLTINRKDDLMATEAVVTSIADPSLTYTYSATFSLNEANDEVYFGMVTDHCHLLMKTMTVKELTETMPDNPPDAPVDTNSKQILVESITAKAGTKKVSGTFTTNVTDLNVSVQVNKGTAVETTANGKKFSVTLKSKLKGGDKITVTMKGDGYYDKTQTVTVKYTNLKVKKVTAKKNTKKITGTVTVKKATVKIKVGKKAYKKAKVSGKKYTLKVAKLKKGTKVTVKATKKNYVTATKSVKVK